MSRALLLLCCVSVFAIDDPMTVTVNQVKLYEGSNYDNIQYRYFDGDTVEVLCNKNGEEYYSYLSYASLSLSYDYVDKELVKGTDVNMQIVDVKENYQSVWAGLRVVLQASHNGSRVTCRYHKNGTLNATAHITFILDNSDNDLINLKINGLALRPQNIQKSSKYDVYFKVENDIMAFSYMVFECDNASDDIVLESYHYEGCSCQWPQTLQVQKFDLLTTGARLVSDYRKYLRYQAINKTIGMLPVQVVDFAFKPIQYSKYDGIILTVTGPHYNQTTEVYTTNNIQFNYYYADGDTVTLNCEMTRLSPFDIVYIQLDGRVYRHNSSITTEMKLTSADNNRLVSCIKLKVYRYRRNRRQKEVVLATKSVLFRQVTTPPRPVPTLAVSNTTDGASTNRPAATKPTLSTTTTATIHHKDTPSDNIFGTDLETSSTLSNTANLTEMSL